MQVQLVRIQLRVPEYGWTTQKVFHLLNALVCSLRCGSFLFRGQMQQLHPDAVRLVLFDLPGEGAAGDASSSMVLRQHPAWHGRGCCAEMPTLVPATRVPACFTCSESACPSDLGFSWSYALLVWWDNTNPSNAPPASPSAA